MQRTKSNSPNTGFVNKLDITYLLETHTQKNVKKNNKKNNSNNNPMTVYKNTSTTHAIFR